MESLHAFPEKSRVMSQAPAPLAQVEPEPGQGVPQGGEGPGRDNFGLGGGFLPGLRFLPGGGN